MGEEDRTHEAAKGEQPPKPPKTKATIIPPETIKMLEKAGWIAPPMDGEKRFIVASSGDVRWQGFRSMYEVIGLIDTLMQPDDLKREVSVYYRKRVEAAERAKKPSPEEAAAESE